MGRGSDGLQYVGELEVGSEIKGINNAKAEYRFTLQLTGINPVEKTTRSLPISLTNERRAKLRAYFPSDPRDRPQQSLEQHQECRVGHLDHSGASIGCSVSSSLKTCAISRA